MSTGAGLPRTLEATVAAFCAYLREECAFAVGPGESVDALRALDAVGLGNRQRVGVALRLVFCATREQGDAFDRAFDAFFTSARQGVPQSRTAPRTDRQAPLQTRRAHALHAPPAGVRSDAGAAADSPGGVAPATSTLGTPPSEVTLVPARASGATSDGIAPALRLDDTAQLLVAADRLVRRLRFGRTRRWHRMPAGGRLDVRRTLRASLRTAGEPFEPHWLGHPHRNPRIVVVIDASRSMQGHAAAMVRFAWALVRRSRRVNVFAFSTALHDVTRALRDARGERTLLLPDLPSGWGGGTQIGSCLRALVREHGHRTLTRDTVVAIFSDGLDVGDPQTLSAAMRDVRRRSAAIVWLNPLLGAPGYAPVARGMRAALPFIDLFAPASDEASLLRFATDARIGHAT